MSRRRELEYADCDPWLGEAGAVPAEHLPYVILLARALGVRGRWRRARAIRRLAAEYRALFPPGQVRPGAPASSGLGP